MEGLIYLDYNSTTKIDDRVLEKMMPFLTGVYANPSSNHAFGIATKRAIDEAREKVAGLVGCQTKDITWTSGATEALNTVLKGMRYKGVRSRNHIVTVCTEHAAVLDSCRYLEGIGYDITYLPVQRNGLINLDLLRDALRTDTLAVCIMIANNETGVIQPIEAIAEIVHENDSLFVTDATQAVGKIPVNMEDSGIDILALSGHKFYGPKGVGALCIRKARYATVSMSPLIHGGAHEHGMRSGTLNVPAIVGLGFAAELSQHQMEIDRRKIEPLRNRLEEELLNFKNSYINGDTIKRMYHVTNICFPGVVADDVIAGNKLIAIANGSACSSELIEPSHVLTAMGLSEDDANSSLRFSLGRFTTEEEIDRAVTEIMTLLNSAKQQMNV